MTSARAWLVILAVAAVGGCGPRRPELAAVEGTVTLDGRPLAHGIISFEAEGRRPATARIVDGRIVEATTYRPGDGVPTGRHRVAVTAREQAAAAAPANPGQATIASAGAMAGKLLVPSRYTDPATSGLTVTIAAEPNRIDLQLATKPP